MTLDGRLAATHAPATHAAASGRPGPAAWARRLGRHLGAVVLFALPAVALWWHAWDGNLSGALTCACGDAGQTVWFTAWPAYALAHGLDPFFSGALQAPYGVNLLDNASAVPVGIALAPVTWVAGPVVSTTLALTLCPAVSAWACWVACRRLVAWRPAAAVAGLLYGYCPFVVDNLALGHVSLTFLAVPPLLVVAAQQVLVGPEAARTRWGAAAGGLLALQFLLSGEVLAIVVVVGVPAALVALLLAGPRRPTAVQLARPLLAGALVAGALLALPAWYFLAGTQHLSGPLWGSASIQGNALSGLWDPGRYRAPATTLQALGGDEGRRGPPSGYLGPVVLAALAASAALAWRRRALRVLAAAGVVALTCSFGIVLFGSPGHVLAPWMPWRLVAGWPLLQDVVPQRFSLVADLCVALVVGVGLDAAHRRMAGTPRRARAHARVRPRAGGIVLALAAAATCLAAWSTFEVPIAVRSVAPPSWFRVQAPQLRHSAVLLTYPFPYPGDGDSGPMVWQAVDGMPFRLAGGYVKAPAPDGRPLATEPDRQPYAFLAALSSAAVGPLPRLTPGVRRSLRAALHRWGVTEVVVTDHGRDPAAAAAVFRSLLGRPFAVRPGARVWALGTVPDAPPGTSSGDRRLSERRAPPGHAGAARGTRAGTPAPRRTPG